LAFLPVDYNEDYDNAACVAEDEVSAPSTPHGTESIPTPLRIVSTSPQGLHDILRAPRDNQPSDFAKCIRYPDEKTHPTSEQDRKARFFADEHARKGSGLIGMAVYVFKDLCGSSSDQMSLSWVLFSLLLALLLLDTRHSQQSSFCFLLELLKSKLAPDAILPIPLPTSVRQAKYYYVDYNSSAKGQVSLLEEFILPKPETLDGGHVYVPLLTTIQYVHALGHILEPSFLIDSENSTVYQSTFLHSRTPRAWLMLRNCLQRMSCDGVPSHLSDANIHEVTVPLARKTSYVVGMYNLIFWSDSFEAFGTKQNRGSVWVLFCSVATPSTSPNSSQNTFNAGHNTFLVAIGPSGKEVSHDCVWQRLLVDLKYLNDGNNPIVTYSRYHKRLCRSLFPIYVFLQDTPERTESNGLASWKSTTNILYGHVSPLVKIQGRLPSCYKCFYNRINSLPVSGCKRCLDWDVPEVVAITYCELKSVVASAQAKCIAGELKTKAKLVAYFRSAGIAPSLATSMSVQLLADPAVTPSTPALWDYSDFVDVNDSIEVVMHLLFLGIARSLAKDTVYSFLAGRKQWSSFVDRVHYIFNRIHKLGIYWIRPHPISPTGSFGGWVSENYLGFSRISKYLGALTDSLSAHDEPYKDPDVVPNKMSLPQLQRWLKVRGIPVSKPTGQVRPRKCDYLATVEATGWRRPGDPPALSLNMTDGIPLQLYENVIASCHSMTASIMSVRELPTDDERFEMLQSIKTYLSYDNLFHTWNPGDQSVIPTVCTGGPSQPTLSTYPPESPANSPSQFGMTVDQPWDVTDDDDSSASSVDDSDNGSISDDSGGEFQDAPALVPQAFVASYRIPALAKRNKINLLKIPATVFGWGSYSNMSELGQKGEGAIQTVKPVVKKLGAVAKPGWATHVARGWLRRRFSRNAISLTIEAMTEEASKCSLPSINNEDVKFLDSIKKALIRLVPSEEKTTETASTFCNLDADGWGNLVDAVCTGSDLPSKRMFFVYKNREAAISALSWGLEPVSVVILRGSMEDPWKPWYAVVYKGGDKALHLLKIHPVEFLLEKCKAAFFKWSITSPSEESNSCEVDVPIQSCHVFDDYGLLLPLDTLSDNGRQVVYYMITYWWNEMLANGSLARYKC
jgi:hypothetical protein